MVRKAELRDLDALLRLLLQVAAVHHAGRPDLFKAGAAKYTRAELEALLQRPDVGRALYNSALAQARALGCYNVTLNVWSCNPGAAAFYQSLGMQPYKIGMETIL